MEHKTESSQGVIVFRHPPTYNVKIRALSGEVKLVQAEDLKGKGA